MAKPLTVSMKHAGPIRIPNSRVVWFQIKIITGIRRCGKSFLLFNLFKRQLKLDGVDKEG